MLEGRAIIQDTDMPVKMQLQAMSCAYEALDLFDVLDCKGIAAHIKKVSTLFFFFFFSLDLASPFLPILMIVVFQEFDVRYGPGWQCVVGSKFGCFFTHRKGTFIYFCLERLNFLIFKGPAATSTPTTNAK
ncbi:hypothetical protein BHE74_00004154 [Ensete ventricosum]|nr:hypothetical protein BHE74_00004154 [Ensete ventricosum]